MAHPIFHVVLLAASGLTTAVLAAYAWRHRTDHAVRPFGGLMVGFTLYSGAHLIGLLTLHPTWRLVWEYLQWTGAAVIPLFWLLFAMEYTGYDRMLTRRTVGALSLVPVLTIVLAWTNPWHGLLWSRNTVVVVEGLAILEQPFGPWAVVFTGFGYVIMGIGSFLILRLIWVSNRLYSGQAILLVVALTVPLVANLMTVFELTFIRDPPIDMTPYAFSITGLAFGYALFRSRLFTLVPATRELGRNAAIRDLEEGVIIVDEAHRIIYCNPAAATLLDRDKTRVLGEPVQSLIDGSNLDFATDDALAEIAWGEDVYAVRSSPIKGGRGRIIGYTLLVQDITARKRRERRITRQRDELVRLDRLNAIIRGVNQALISATSRAEIEEAVCRNLVQPELYQTACIADIPTWNGDADRWTVVTADGDPAVADELPNGLFEVDEEATGAELSAPADDPTGWRVVPLTYGRTVYGVLGLQPGSEVATPEPCVSERERDALTDLGTLIGHAISAVENRQLLAAESVVELELHSTDESGPLVAAAQAGATLEVTGFVPNAGDGHLAYVRVENGSVDAVAAGLAAHEGASCEVIQDDDDGAGGLLEWIVPPASPLGTLAEHGANVLEASIEDGTARYVAEVASEADVRAVGDRIQRRVPDTWLEAMRPRDRATRQADSVSSQSIEHLTERQQEALEAAYRAGYYDWPRESTAEEVANTLDIASPTLHAHLRKAEGTLLAELFDRESQS